jgi:hypothetical protein
MLLAMGLVAGCSKSECLREDCASAAPVSSTAGGASASGSSVSSVVRCAADGQCATANGEFCVEGTCRLACTTHYDCQGYGECLSNRDADGTAGHYCDLSHPQKPGQFYSHCPSGDSNCDSANGFLCIGAGADDLNAYCTTDCTDDSTCADGYACTPLTRSPCADDCGVSGVPKDPQCVPIAQIGAGLPYQCGTRGATRNICRPRQFCSPCTTDADCFAAANQVCAKDKSGAKICTQLCDTKHPACPWGSAASCGVWDQDLALATCAHRYGKCVGTGKDCEPCLKDSDCGSNGVCNESEFTGEHWCVDLSVNCTCNGDVDENNSCTGGGCPTSPSGLELICVDNSTNDAGPPSGVCDGANTATSLSASSQIGCWPSD